ncbi:MAG: suppressor of fused domain protein [Capnocytophaga sp.]|nr:suppressor of fused domain protein [Capnocytophaga sp.]
MIHKLFYYLSEKAEPVVQSFNPPAAPEAIQAFENKHQITLPEMFKELYLKHNGQNPDNGHAFIDEQRLLSLEEIDHFITLWKMDLEELFGSDWANIRKDFTSKEEVMNTLYHHKWIPFFVSENAYTCIDLAPNHGGSVSQVICVLPSGSLEYYDIFVEDVSFPLWIDEICRALADDIIMYDSEAMTITDLVYPDDGFAPEPDEFSEGGSAIYRYETHEEEGFRTPENEAVYLEEITRHLEKHIGPVESVFHEILSEYVHIDVHWIKPNEAFPYNILVTSGMSDMPMHLPAGLENPRQYMYGEMMVILPAHWEISEEAFENENNYWPVYFLKMLARLPHQYKSWLAYGHTLPNGENADPIANTNFGCMMVMPPFVTFDEDFLQMETSDGNIINFYAMIPLYKEEMELKLNLGVEALLDKFDDYGILEVIDINRPNTAL